MGSYYLPTDIGYNIIVSIAEHCLDEFFWENLGVIIPAGDSPSSWSKKRGTWQLGETNICFLSCNEIKKLVGATNLLYYAGFAKEINAQWMWELGLSQTTVTITHLHINPEINFQFLYWNAYIISITCNYCRGTCGFPIHFQQYKLALTLFIDNEFILYLMMKLCVLIFFKFELSFFWYYRGV